jgi:hypothetical protein
MGDPLLIVLAPPRSFSSVVGGMLGQHPDLYGFPELNLFSAETIGRLQMAYRRAGDQARHGLLRSLAELHDGDQTEATVDAAQAWVDAHRRWTTKQVFDHLLEQVHPKIGVEKSPRTVMKLEYLERAYALYPGAQYLHLTRHPRSTAVSQVNITSRNEEWGGRLDASRINPDRWWLRAQENILQVTSRMAPGQCMRIKGEELLAEPDLYLPQIAEWLGVRTDAEAIEQMKHPETSPYASIGPDNAKYGNDINFLNSPEFRPRAEKTEEPDLESPLEWAPERRFSAEVVKLAREYGYR